MISSDIVLVCSVLVQVTLSIDPPDCRVRYDDPCDGVAVSGNMTTQVLKTLYNHFCGCVYVTGAIKIQVTSPDLIVNGNTSLTENDFSFFYHIREIHDYLLLQNIPQIDQISFPNLRIIRGEELYTDQYAITVLRSSISNLYMPNLTEITKGNVRFTHDEWDPVPYLCNVLTVNWADILPLNGTLIQDLNNCTDQFKPNCSFLGCDYCWCDDMSADQCCQELTRDCLNMCKSGTRCHRQTTNGTAVINCCNSVCAGGCDGINDTHCRACKLPTVHVLNGDTCEDACPARYSSTGIENPDYLFKHQDLCVKPCPKGTFELNDAVCVELCPTGMRSVPSNTGGMKCETCNGYYCKECKGGMYQNLEDDCTLITGSLTVIGYSNSITGWWTVTRTYIDKFPKLKSIRVIRGKLLIRDLKVEHFTYLSNLEVVGDNSSPEVGSCFQYGFKLVLNNNYGLVSIDLSSLKTIVGRVRMNSNPKLCIFGNFKKFLLNGLESHNNCLKFSSNYRRPLHKCVADNLACHSECDPIDGCWGNTDADCITCINYRYKGRCVPTCEDLGEYLYRNYSTKSCEPCHKLCKDRCSGEGPTHCHSCRTGVFSTINNGTGFECLNECNTSNYYAYRQGNPAGKFECLPCSNTCMEGCVGSLNVIDHSHGCLTCDTVILDRTGHQVTCTDECPDDHYIDENSTSPLSVYAGQICVPCHENCYECDGPELTDCIRCKVDKQCHIDTTTAASPVTSSSTDTSIAIPTSSTVDTTTSTLINTGTSFDWIYFIILPVAVIILIPVIASAVVGGFYYRKHKKKSLDATRIGAATNHVETIRYSSGFIFEQMGIQGSLFKMSQQQLMSLSAFEIPQDVLIPRTRITLFESIGQGEFGVVYRALLLDEDNTRKTVAVKTIKGDFSPKELNDLLEESLLMKDINHSNVMGLIGICTDGEAPFIVLPYMEGGALLEYLRNNRYSLLISSTETVEKIGEVQLKLTAMCLQIAKGMEYLAKQNLIHRDLAARNCMLDSHCNIKVADFGLSKGLYYKAYFRQEKNESVKLPVKWLAIESMEYGMFSEKSDVWAYGVTCWEVFSCGKMPYGGVAPNNVLKLLKSDQRMGKPENAACSDEVFQELIINCWKSSPEERPCFSEIVKYLDKFVSSMAGYLMIVNESNKIADPVITAVDNPHNDAK